MKKLIFVIAIASMFASCKNLVPYSDALRTDHNWTTDQVKQIQFYNSHDIVLRRELVGGSSEIVHGHIQMVDGKKVDEILIRQGTPGVLTSIPKEDKMLVSFEIGDDHSLSFGVNPNEGERYVLLASEWSNGMGKVHYAGDEYYTGRDARFTCLEVDLRKINKTDMKSHVAKGRKIK